MNEIEKNNQIVSQVATQSLIQDACTIIDQAQTTAYRQVNETLIKRNWLLGMRIQHEVLKEKRAEYGQQVVKNLAQSLLERYGRGFSMRNLYNFVDFYQSHPDIFHAVSGESTIVNAVSVQSEVANILQSLTAKSLSNSSQQPNILQIKNWIRMQLFGNSEQPLQTGKLSEEIGVSYQGQSVASQSA